MLVNTGFIDASHQQDGRHILISGLSRLDEGEWWWFAHTGEGGLLGHMYPGEGYPLPYNYVYFFSLYFIHPSLGLLVLTGII